MEISPLAYTFAAIGNIFNAILKIRTATGKCISREKTRILKLNVLLFPTDFICRYALNGNCSKVSNNKYIFAPYILYTYSQADVTSIKDEKTTNRKGLFV